MANFSARLCVFMICLYLLVGFASANVLALENDSICDYKIDILLNKTAFTLDDFNFRLKVIKIEGKPTTFTAKASIKDSSGTIIKKYMPWTNEPISVKKTSNVYKPNLIPDNYAIDADVEVLCEDVTPSNNIASKDFEIIESRNNSLQDLQAEKLIEKDKSKISFASEISNVKINDAKKYNLEKKQGRVVYESKFEFMKKMVIVILALLSVLLNIILIWKR